MLSIIDCASRISVSISSNTPRQDSGDSGTITLSDGDDLTVAALPNTSGGSAPISLVALNGAGSLEILDVNTPTSLQVVHASPDAPAVDDPASKAVRASEVWG